jgi:pimeloyl-ACP methyl ester carboxylesterase
VPELDRRGHRSIVMDLPSDDGSATFDDYAAVVVDALRGCPDDVIVVGHSLGAMVPPIVAATRPVGSILFLCGVIPNPGGMPWDDAPEMGRPEAYECEELEDGSTRFVTQAAATASFFGDCSPEDAAWAFARMRPQNSTSLWDRPYPLTHLPEVTMTAICALDDAAITIEHSRFVVRDRLGLEPVELPGGHSPFLARPALLADVLVDLSSAVWT